MKKVFIVLLAALSIMSCRNKSNVHIEGTIDDAQGKTIYLSELLVSSQKVVDSVKVSKAGEFKFKAKVSQPSFYLLKFSDRNFVTLLVDSAETIKVTGNFKRFPRNYKVSGSDGSALVRELNIRFAETKAKTDSLQNLYRKYDNDPEYADKLKVWADEYSKLVSEQKEYSTKFVTDNPFSLASLMALYQKWDENSYVVEDLQAMKVAASALNAMFPNSPHVQSLHKNTLTIMRSKQNQQMAKIIEEVAQNSPEVTLPNTQGKDVSLSSLRGKYVLLHFWAAADRGSRIMNPVLVENYKKYKRKGFEIYQVSVDNNKALWENAIREDNLSWINVGDMKGSNSAVLSYNVSELPFNYLLGPEGEILAKNLKGPALGKALARYVR